MKIAITNAFLPSEQQAGVPNQVHRLANALVARGHDVTVFSFSPRPADAAYALHRFARPSVPARFLPFVMAYRLATTDFRAFDVLNVHGDNYLMRPSRPVVRTFHGSAVDEMRNAGTMRRKLFFLVTIPLEALGARLADHVVGVSETTRVRFRSLRTVIPCGVDRTMFRASEKTTRPTVLFVGTETGRKRGAWLAELFARDVLPLVPNAELRMVSDGAGDAPGVRRYGRVTSETLGELYGSAWAFCLPSTYEGFGVPYIEAMAAEAAVIATAPNPGANEVLANGAFGAYVADDALASTLVAVLTDDAAREALVRAGRARSAEYDWRMIAARYETVFGEAIAAKAAA
jgi:glycosyltransferase involved in cell wall biosynthesis